MSPSRRSASRAPCTPSRRCVGSPDAPIGEDAWAALVPVSVDSTIALDFAAALGQRHYGRADDPIRRRAAGGRRAGANDLSSRYTLRAARRPPPPAIRRRRRRLDRPARTRGHRGRRSRRPARRPRHRRHLRVRTALPLGRRRDEEQRDRPTAAARQRRHTVLLRHRRTRPPTRACWPATRRTRAAGASEVRWRTCSTSTHSARVRERP